MTTILIADGIIENPSYGKLGPFTSDGFSRTVADIYNTNTDCELGGESIAWNAVSAGISPTGCWRTENGLFRPIKAGGQSSVCLNKEFHNLELHFNVAVIESNFEGQIFIDVLRQLNTSETYRFRFTQSEILFLYRDTSNVVQTLASFAYSAGDKVTYTYKDGKHAIKVNNTLITELTKPAIAGYIGVSKASVTSTSGVIYLDNFVIYEK